MKKNILTLAVFTMLAGTILTSCMTPAQKVKNAQNNVKEANVDLDKANREYLADVENYRKETAAKIAANDLAIAEFNTKIENEKEDAKADYTKKVAVLKQKNIDMKMRMDDYKVDGKEKWKMFKTEFGHDMDELGKAFKDLVVKNTN
ncbi:hypothetical protein [Runella sp.]|uniref:hypothetical protein n=1 Tax=Runella sp. TaxID=1960881 RepID=UPI003D0D87C0